MANNNGAGMLDQYKKLMDSMPKKGKLVFKRKKGIPEDEKQYIAGEYVVNDDA